MLAQATLQRCPSGTWMHRGGRTGRHTEHLGPMLSVMQHLQRTHPGATYGTALLGPRPRGGRATVVDPEIPVLTIADLGVLRDVQMADGQSVEVTITPTYSGCPAMNMIAVEIGLALDRAGIPDARVRTVLFPAWTTDWMTVGRAPQADGVRHRAARPR